MTKRERPPGSPLAPDQQPIRRVVGRRVQPLPGQLPRGEARDAMTLNARYTTRAPKGVFIYQSHEDMARDRERWTIDAMVARHRGRD